MRGEWRVAIHDSHRRLTKAFNQTRKFAMRVIDILSTSARHLALAGLGLLAASASCQINVTVDASRTINVLPPYTMGVYTRLDDGDLLGGSPVGTTPAVPTPAALRAAGLTTVTYPTGWNNTSGTYHWSVNKIVKAGNANDPSSPYFNDQNDFGHFAQAMVKYGISPILYVNYASNLKGTGGGAPQEAAAWVAYCNALPTDGATIGTDPTGQDWKTSGYWASIRAAAPLAQDDGYNFLRISHPEPLHVQLWQIGEDVADNGYYGGDHKASLDMHAPYPPASAQNGNRKKLKELSPGFYGDQVVAFAAAMKAVDPSISVGASLVTPNIYSDQVPWAPDWNSSVLKSACKSLDFISYPWQTGNTQPPDWKRLDDASLFDGIVNQLPQILTRTIDDDKAYCPAGKIPRVVLSSFSPIPWAQIENPMVLALFAAETYATLARDGISNASWMQLRDGLPVFGKDNKPTQVYYGAQMLHIVANKPGDAFIPAAGSGSIAAVATHRRDGIVAVMLVNHDKNQAVPVKVTVNGVDLSGAGRRFEYGPAQYAKGAGFDMTDIKADGKTVTVTVPAYGIVDLMLGTKK